MTSNTVRSFAFYFASKHQAVNRVQAIASANSTRCLFSRSMSSSTLAFKSWTVNYDESNESYVGKEETHSVNDLPYKDDDSSILIRVSHSSLNYKDALSATGNKGVTRTYPHTPGIDAAGVCIDETGKPISTDENCSNVIVTGYDLGMNTAGGFGEVIRVPKDWVIQPSPFKSAKTAMVYGTAGLTAGLCVQRLLTSGSAKPSDGAVAVTGATGAVGSVAVELLSNLGFQVIAITGKGNTHKKFLTDLGAQEVVGRDALEPVKKPLMKPCFAHAIDTVGGNPLAELLKRIQPGGSVACCGLVAGPQLSTTVLPFILRGVQLLGVDSVEIPLEEKRTIWENLATTWACPKAEASAIEIGRDQLDEHLNAFLKGLSSGKIILNHSLTETAESTT